MSNKIGICLECGKESKLTRGYCSSSCYCRLLRSGQLQRIEYIDPPNKLNDTQKEILIGSLLGDGCLYTPNENKYSPILSIKRKREDMEYLEYQFSFFQDFCFTGVTIYDIYDERTQETYEGCGFSTRRCQVLLPYYQEWYPEREKIIPKDLKLTPLICAIWFCDDGCIFVDERDRLHVKLSTHGFPNEDTKWLAGYMRLLLGEHFSIGYDHDHAFIIGADAASKSLIKYIEGYIPSSMKRKITWAERHFAMKRSRPHIKNRVKTDFNDKEFGILLSLQDGVKKSSLEICKELKWITSSGRVPSAYNRYLKRFLLEDWIAPVKIVLNGKSNTKYLITNSGKKLLDEIISINTKND